MTARTARNHRRGLSLILALALAASLPARAFAAPDERELVAREDFAAGRYQQALEIFARLYAETLHPNYLRNIGRCYQNLGEPDRAITSFREYLHKAKSITPDERAEIQGYIKDMEELKRTRAESGARAPAAPPPARSVAVAPPPPAAPPSQTRIDLTVKSPPPAPADEAAPALYERWWFWAIVAGAVGAGVGVAAAAGAFTHTKDASCAGTDFTCGQ